MILPPLVFPDISNKYSQQVCELTKAMAVYLCLCNNEMGLFVVVTLGLYFFKNSGFPFAKSLTNFLRTLFGYRVPYHKSKWAV